uniref:Uncharacterized protein n=1 Tax=Lepeophtheirus salmonis TaxID=72036 RepID=A0A0K2TUF8_LEPSM
MKLYYIDAPGIL